MVGALKTPTAATKRKPLSLVKNVLFLPSKIQGYMVKKTPFNSL